jgi:hypothetical protein
MAIPHRLDGFAIGDRVITPHIASNMDTMEVEIEVHVTDAKTNAVIETQTLSSEEAYLKYEKGLLGRI